MVKTRCKEVRFRFRGLDTIVSVFRAIATQHVWSVSARFLRGLTYTGYSVRCKLFFYRPHGGFVKKKKHTATVCLAKSLFFTARKNCYRGRRKDYESFVFNLKPTTYITSARNTRFLLFRAAGNEKNGGFCVFGVRPRYTRVSNSPPVP